MRDALFGVVFGVAVCAVVFGLAWIVDAQPRVQWVNEPCWTNECVANKLNSLSPERAAEAKVTTWNSITYVWYRQ